MVAMADKQGPKKRAGGRPKSPKPKRQIVSMRGSEEWRDWLNEIGDRARLKASDLVDHALAEFAERRGYPPPPKR